MIDTYYTAHRNRTLNVTEIQNQFLIQTIQNNDMDVYVRKPMMWAIQAAEGQKVMSIEFEY